MCIRDSINTGAGNDTINITSTTYASDTLNGGADSDTLAITGGGTVNMNSATISGFENVSINNGAVSANVFTAQICKLTDQKPAEVCTSSGVTAAAAAIK